MKLLRKEIIQKSLFAISVFALGIVSAGRLETKTSVADSRKPASTLHQPHLVKQDTTVLVANSATCDYSAKNRKVCEN